MLSDVVPKSLADKFGWKLGDRVPIEGDIYPVNLELNVSGIYTGKLDAMYFNPKALPFAKAEAARGVSLRAHFELRAGGYAGSTYDLTYDQVSDRLRGTYYQAVAKQKFDVYFMRK